MSISRKVWHAELEEQDVLHTVNSSFLQVVLRDVAAAFQFKISLPLPLFLQSACNAHELLSFHVVKHDYIGPCIDGFICLRFRLYFDF